MLRSTLLYWRRRLVYEAPACRFLKHFSTHIDMDELFEPKRPFEYPDENFKLLWERIDSGSRTEVTLAQWENEGRPLSKELLEAVLVKLIRSRSWYCEARRVLNWVDQEQIFEFTSRDRLIHLEIFRRSKAGWWHVHRMFESIPDKPEQAYLILLETCLSQKRLKSAEEVFESMRNSQLLRSAEPYNIMMKLYLRMGLVDKAVSTYADLKASGVAPNFVTYWILMPYTDKFDSDTFVKEAEAALQNRVEPQNWRAMLRLQGHLGNAEGVEQIWNQMEGACQERSNNYLSAMKAFASVGQVQKVKEMAKEWEQTHGVCYQQSLVLLWMYADQDMMDRVEVMLQKFSQFRWEIDSPCNYQVIVAYLRRNDLSKAMELFTCEWFKHKCRGSPNQFSSKPALALLEYCAETGDVSNAESLMEMFPGTRDPRIYKALLRVYVKDGRSASGVTTRMKARGVEMDEECRQLLAEADPTYFSRGIEETICSRNARRNR